MLSLKKSQHYLIDKLCPVHFLNTYDIIGMAVLFLLNVIKSHFTVDIWEFWWCTLIHIIWETWAVIELGWWLVGGQWSELKHAAGIWAAWVSCFLTDCIGSRSTRLCFPCCVGLLHMDMNQMEFKPRVPNTSGSGQSLATSAEMSWRSLQTHHSCQIQSQALLCFSLGKK